MTPIMVPLGISPHRVCADLWDVVPRWAREKTYMFVLLDKMSSLYCVEDTNRCNYVIYVRFVWHSIQWESFYEVKPTISSSCTSFYALIQCFSNVFLQRLKEVPTLASAKSLFCLFYLHNSTLFLHNFPPGWPCPSWSGSGATDTETVTHLTLPLLTK